MKQEPSLAISPSPAAAKAARMVADQVKLAQELDTALQRAGEIRDRFESEGTALEAFLRTMAFGIGLAPGRFEYDGSRRAALWVRSRGLTAGFAAYEEQQLQKLREALTSGEEVMNV